MLIYIQHHSNKRNVQPRGATIRPSRLAYSYSWARLASTHQKSVQLVSSWCILWVSELFLFVLYSSSFAFRSVQTTNCKMCATRTYLRVYASNAVCKKDLLSESNEDTRHCLNAVHPDCSAHRGNCFVMT